jgi:bacterial microcompartment shell vertex protein
MSNRLAKSARMPTQAWPGAEGHAILRAMQLARVVGRVVSTVKQDTLSGVTLQWLQPVNSRGTNAGKPLIAVDRVGVGPGEFVYYITSREAAMTLDNPFAAVDAGIVGKVDHVDLGSERLLDDSTVSGR